MSLQALKAFKPTCGVRQQAQHGDDVGWQAAAAAQAATAAAEEQLEESRTRLAARERWLAGERAELDAKVAQATAPAVAQQQARSSAVDGLRQQVQQLR